MAIHGDECLLILANKKFTRFRIKDKSENTFIKYVVSRFIYRMPDFTKIKRNF